MFCQYCLSSEPYPLVGMQSTSFVYNGLLINYLDCFKQCKQLKIEDEHTAYICTTCIPVLTKEYTLKQLENDQTGFSVVSIKEEPGLNLDKSIETATINSRLAIKTDRTDLQITISVANSEKGSLKTESTIEAVSTPYEKVQFVVSEIKEEEELQIVDEVDCASFDLKTETELTFEYALDSAGNHIILQYQPVLYGSDGNYYKQLLDDDDDTGSTSRPVIETFVQEKRWHRNAILALLDLYKTHCKELTSNTKRRSQAWSDLSRDLNAAGFGFTGVQCENKFNNLKKKNLKKKATMDPGFDYFVEFDGVMIDKNPTITPITVADSLADNIYDPNSDESDADISDMDDSDISSEDAKRIVDYLNRVPDRKQIYREIHEIEKNLKDSTA